MEGWRRRAPRAWGAGRAKPTQQVGRELGGPPPIPAPHPCEPTVTLFLALRTAWGDGQRGQSSPVTTRLSTGMRWSPQSTVTLHRAKGGKGAAQSECSATLAAVSSASCDTHSDTHSQCCSQQGPPGAGRVLGRTLQHPNCPVACGPLRSTSFRSKKALTWRSELRLRGRPAQSPALVLPNGWVPLHPSPNCSGPQFPPLSKGNNGSTWSNEMGH